MFAQTIIDKPSCEHCRELYADEGKPPCEQIKEVPEGEDTPPEPRCEWGVPDVMPGNVEAVKIWGRCRKQVIPGMNGPIDINVIAVRETMDLYGVKNQRRCLEKVRILSDEYWAVVMEREHGKSKD